MTQINRTGNKLLVLGFSVTIAIHMSTDILIFWPLAKKNLVTQSQQTNSFQICTNDNKLLSILLIILTTRRLLVKKIEKYQITLYSKLAIWREVDLGKFNIRWTSLLICFHNHKVSMLYVCRLTCGAVYCFSCIEYNGLDCND